MRNYLAIDLGASSGRHIIGKVEDGKIELEEIHRFSNGVKEENGSLVWDVESLFLEIKKGIKIALEKYPKIESMAIDTWGVDYVLMRGDKEVLPVYAYRDTRTDLSTVEVHRLIPYEKLYKKTGVEYNVFNSIYQFYADKLAGRLEGVTDILMLPCYFSYKLTGRKAWEYTNATTTATVNATTCEFDDEILTTLGLNKDLFKNLVRPPYMLGNFTEEIAKEVGGNIPVLLCASHDTASAVYGIPMEGNSPYISSGTWSLVGVKTEKAIVDKGTDISNEGGVTGFRHQKNVMGMWLINRLRDDIGGISFSEMVDMAKNSDYTELFDVNDKTFFAPKSMKKAILDYLQNNGKKAPKNDGDIINSVYHSLAKSYADTYALIEKNTGKTYEEFYIVGGGAKNEYLNDLTEKYSGKKVIALPIEATALGNIKIQTEYK